MGSPLITFFVFVAVMAVGMLLFTGWVVFTVVRLIGRSIGFLLGPDRGRAAEMLPGAVDRRCPNPTCRATNPVSARFCRRCGRSLIGNPRMMDSAAHRTGRVPSPPAARWDPAAELAAGERTRM